MKLCLFCPKKDVWMIPHEICKSCVFGQDGPLQSFTFLFCIQSGSGKAMAKTMIKAKMQCLNCPYETVL